MAIRSAVFEDRFVGANEGGGPLLRARSEVISGGEVFLIYALERKGLRGGAPVLLRLGHGRYVRAGAGGHLEPVALSGPTPPELFFTTEASPPQGGRRGSGKPCSCTGSS